MHPVQASSSVREEAAMDIDYESNTKVRSRGSSAVIELDIAYTGDRKMSRTSSLHSRASMSRQSMTGSGWPSMLHRGSYVYGVGEAPEAQRDEMSELGETLEHLTSEYGKPFCIAVDEDGCPDKPPDMHVFRYPYLKSVCRSYREAIRPAPYRYVTLNFRIMRRNAAMYVGYMASQKNVQRSELYTPEQLPIWTHCVRVRMRANVKIGVIFHGLKSRLGLTSVVGLHFCVDGFFGLEAFGDAFGNVGSGNCPWMELSSNGSAKSLRLRDGDNIYLSVATESMRHLAHQRKMRANRRPSLVNAVTLDRSPGAAKRGKPETTDFVKTPLELDF